MAASRKISGRDVGEGPLSDALGSGCASIRLVHEAGAEGAPDLAPHASQ